MRLGPEAETVLGYPVVILGGVCSLVRALAALPDDPVLVYATYVPDFNEVRDVAADSMGNAYLVGNVSRGPISRPPAIAKLDPSGRKLLWLVTFGGTALEAATAVAVDPSGNAYVTGGTTSSDFRVTERAFLKTRPPGLTTAFIVKFDPEGNIVYSSYVPGNWGRTIAVDAVGQAYVAGETDSPNFPATVGAFQTKPPGGPFPGDGYIVKISAAGDSILYATYLGGTGGDRVTAIAADGDGNAYAVGTTTSKDFPTTPGALQRSGPLDPYPDRGIGFFAKLNSTGTALLYSTYLGQRDGTGVSSVAVDERHNVYLGGTTDSPDFPTTPGAFQTQWPGYFAGFIMKLDEALGLVYSTFFGRGVISLAVNRADEVSGFASGIVPRPQTSLPDHTRYVAGLNSSGSALRFAISLGPDAAFSGLAVSGQSVFAAGSAYRNLRTTPGAYQETSGSAFAARIDVSNAPYIREVVNAADPARTALATGEAVRVRGDNFGSDAGVTFDGDPAALVERSPQELVVVTPVLRFGMTMVQATSAGSVSNVLALPVAEVAPGLYRDVRNEDGTRNGVLTPARRGSVLRFNGTGLGNVPPQVYIAGFAAELLAIHPAGPGIVELRARAPDAAPAGSALPLWISVMGVSSSSIPVAVQ
jgi:uncharacterized protein (TIGR03437 family)